MQPHTKSPTGHRTALTTPVRNRYFYGKLLDAYHFELETSYLNGKRWLLNRLVTGVGVVCGLNVIRGGRPDEIVVEPGVAIDRWGREIVVAERSAPVHIPREVYHRAEPCDETRGHEERWVHVVLCYHECLTDPAPVLASECCPDTCAPGAVQERYSLEVRPGWVETPCFEQIPGLSIENGISHQALALWVSRPCRGVPADPCIPLANVRVRTKDDRCHCGPGDIDITARPIVYSNPLLMSLLGTLAGEEAESADDY